MSTYIKVYHQKQKLFFNCKLIVIKVIDITTKPFVINYLSKSTKKILSENIVIIVAKVIANPIQLI